MVEPTIERDREKRLVDRTWKEIETRRTIEDRTVVALVTLFVAVAAGAIYIKTLCLLSQVLLTVCVILILATAWGFLIINDKRYQECARVIRQLNIKAKLFEIPGVDIPHSWTKWGDPRLMGWGTFCRLFVLSILALGCLIVVWNTSPSAKPGSVLMGDNWVMPLVVTNVVAILGLVATTLGWIISHHLTVRRDHEHRRAGERVTYLIAAFRRLAKACHRKQLHKFSEEIESAIADIQLLGNPEQIRMTQDFADNLAKEGRADLDDLLNNLRNELRRQLDLPAVEGNIPVLRIEPKEEQSGEG